jgi:hypothetical protein
MAEADSHLYVIAKAQLRLQVSPYAICIVRCGTGTDFVLSALVFSISITSTFIILNYLIMAWMGHKILDIQGVS